MSTSIASTEFVWLRKVSEHGLGHLLSPLGPKEWSKRWMHEGWLWVLGLADPPEWFALPAVSQMTVSSPRILRAFDGYNQHLPNGEQIKPFNFCLSVQIAAFGHPEGVDPTRFHLIAPYTADPSTYLDLQWADRYSHKSYRITTTDDYGASGAVLVKTYGDVFAGYVRHPEVKSLDADGRAGRGTGLLLRRPVREADRIYIGKESNQVEEAKMGLWHRLDEVLTEYGRVRDPWHNWIVPALKLIPLWWLMEQTRFDRRTIQRLRNRQAEPRPLTEHALSLAAGRWALQRLRERGETAPMSDVLACRAWLERMV